MAINSYLVTYRDTHHKVIQAPSLDAAYLQARRIAGSDDLNDVQQMPDTPEDWHEQEEQFLHTLG